MTVMILINVLLSVIIRAADIPIYFDTVGTIAATALGGPVPGILTAFLSNAVNFFFDGESIFYAPLNMIIALISSGFFGEYAAYRRSMKKSASKNPSGGQKKIIDHVLLTIVFVLIGGGLGSLISWFLNGAPSDSPMIAGFVSFLTNRLHLSAFGSHVVSSIIVDIPDKAISLCLALLIIKITPKKIKEAVRAVTWRQKPLSFDIQKKVIKKLKGRMSIAVRINLIVILSLVIMTITSLFFSALRFKNNTIETLSGDAMQVAYLAASEIEPNMVDVYLRQGERTFGYSRVKERLETIKQSSSNIAFLYVYKITQDGCQVIFDLDTVLSDGSFVEGDPPGTVVPFEKAYESYTDKLLAGEMIPAIKIEDEYGSFYAVYYPVYDRNGKCVCYAISNVETRVADDLIEQYVGRTSLLFIGFLTLVIAISVLTTRYHIVMPIMGMTVYADEMAGARRGKIQESFEKIDELDIRTGDEVELLYRSFRKMTGDLVDNLNENRARSEAVSKMQGVLLMTIADMVENRDANTGAHVVKTAAYVGIILNGLKRNGYYAEKLNDKYMRDVEVSAPLHDVGKISISDSILNKPGKLTPEEYEIMKTHTTAGKAILENAISLMEGGNELKEARNMAAYHHERWDGKGYPEGLHGQVIPLSARIMAVADVFDGVSSSRVYKKSSSFDEAMKVIADGAGTQFDPKIVEVFVESSEEVKKIYRKYQEKA